MSEIKANFLHLLFITKYHSPFVDVVIEDTQRGKCSEVEIVDYRCEIRVKSQGFLKTKFIVPSTRRAK